MNNQNWKGGPTKQLDNENENINSNNTRFHNLQKNGQHQQKRQEQGNKFVAISKSSASADQSRDIFEKVLVEVQDVLFQIDIFNSLDNKQEQNYLVIESLVSKHVPANIHPIAITNVGDFLLRNGKFVVAFIQIMTRKQKKDYLQKYLYNYFSELNHVCKQKQRFEANRQKILRRQKQKIVPSNKDKKLVLLLSPQSSKNQVNWSTKVQQDTNSPFKSSIFDSEYVKKSDQKLKRVEKRVPIQINQQQQRSEKVTKNTRKSTKKTTQKQNYNKSKTKSKSKSKSRSKSKSKQKQQQLKKQKQRQQRDGKQTVPKSANKRQTTSKSNGKKSTKKQFQYLTSKSKNKKNQQTQQNRLGSCYHYQIVNDRKSQGKELVQLRTSARINQNKQRLSIPKNDKNQQRKSVRKSKSKNKNVRQSKSKSKKDSKKDNKKTKKRNNQQQSQDQQYVTDDSYSEDENSQKQIEWIKKHLKSLNIHDIQLYSQFTALTQRDQKITKLLFQMQNSQQAHQANQTADKQTKKRPSDIKQQQQAQNDRTQTRLIRNQQQQIEMVPNQVHQPKPFSQIKKQFEIQQLPLTIDSVIDPDLNNHGIYALLKLGRVTQLQMGTAYAVTPLTYGIKVNRKHIKQDLDKARQLSKQYCENIGYIPTNETILKMIKEKKQQMSK